MTDRPSGVNICSEVCFEPMSLLVLLWIFV